MNQNGTNNIEGNERKNGPHVELGMVIAVKATFFLSTFPLILLTSLSAYGVCSMKPDHSISPLVQKINLYAGSSRYPVSAKDMRTAPYNAVMSLVRFENHKAYPCDTFAVDRQILMTDAHCVLDSDNKEARRLYAFWELYEVFKRAQSLRPKIYYVGTHDRANFTKNDCAVLVLDKPLPAEVIPFEVDTGGICAPNAKLQALGYDKQSISVMVHDPECYQHPEVRNLEGLEDPDDFIFHNCSLTDQGSGSPIYCVGPDNKNYVVGIQKYEASPSNDPNPSHVDQQFSYQTANGAIKPMGCYDKVLELKAKLHAAGNAGQKGGEK